MTFTTCSLLTLHLNHYIHYNSMAGVIVKPDPTSHLPPSLRGAAIIDYFENATKYFTRKIIQPRTEAVDTFLKMLTDMFLFRLFKLWSQTVNI